MYYENLAKATEICAEIAQLQRIIDGIKDNGLWIQIRVPGDAIVTEIWIDKRTVKDRSYETAGHRVRDFIHELTKQYMAEIEYKKKKLAEL